MDYIITTYPTMCRRYLVQDVDTKDKAWELYNSNDYDSDAMLLVEKYLDDDEDSEIELATPELKRQYGLVSNTEYIWRE